MPTREDAARRERWLNERGSIGQLLGSVGKALAQGNIPMRTLFEELDPSGAAAAEKAAQAEARATSELFAQVFGDKGAHARSAFGVAQIPMGACVEIELIPEV